MCNLSFDASAWHSISSGEVDLLSNTLPDILLQTT
jgi:hypothetical protein